METKQKNRRIRYGALSTVITVLVICAVFVLYLVAAKLGSRFGWQVDLTENSRYAISSVSLEAISSLGQDVSIYVMKPENELKSGSYYVVQAYQLLKNYERESSHISLSFIDLTENPAFASRFEGYTLSSWDILVVCGEKAEKLSFSELYEYEPYSGAITASLAERKLTAAILGVSASKKVQIDVITGFGSAKPDALIELLGSASFDVKEVSLLTGEFRDTAEAAILWAPTADLDASSLSKLDSWLYNNGAQGRSLFLFLDPNYAGLTNLEAFAAEWGIRIRDGFAFEASKDLFYQQPFYPIAQYGDMTYAENMTAQDLIIMALCRPLETMFETRDSYSTDVLLTFSRTSGVLPLDAKAYTPEMVTGNVNGMIMSTHSLYGTSTTQSRVIVSGSALAFSGDLLTADVFANGGYLSALIDSLTGNRSAAGSIVPKDLTSPVHSMTSTEAGTAVWSFMIILPLLILCAGLFICLKKRHK